MTTTRTNEKRESSWPASRAPVPGEITEKKFFRKYKLEDKSVARRRDTALRKMGVKNTVSEQNRTSPTPREQWTCKSPPSLGLQRGGGYVLRADVTRRPRPQLARPYSAALARAHHCVAGLGRRCGVRRVFGFSPSPHPHRGFCLAVRRSDSQPSGPLPATDMPRVYIGRLSYNVREKDIQRFFSGYGRLLEIDLKNG